MPVSKSWLAATFGYVQRHGATILGLLASLAMCGLLQGCGDGGGGNGGGAMAAAPLSARVSILTHHYDNARTGWNSRESVLTPAAVGGPGFVQKFLVRLDDQVDAQPLIVSGLGFVGGQSVNSHDVAYVTTENNTVYAIDTSTGQILLARNLGIPVGSPANCGNNGPNIGITSTGVIDLSNNTLYVISYTSEDGAPTYRLHALSLTTLQDRLSAPAVTAYHALKDGTAFAFNATYQRQRAALLLVNRTVYATFASFCDLSADQSRGWILGWNEDTLAPLAANQLTNISTGNGYYLSSIWMSGSGPASDGSYIYAVTGNSNPDGATYDADGGGNFSESLIKVSTDLAKVTDWFTPANQDVLDGSDLDFGAGGVLLLPGAFGLGGAEVAPVAAAGKDGALYLLRAGNLGHLLTPTSPTQPLALVNISPCWCAESFYSGAGGPTVVTSGGGTEPDYPNGDTPEPIELWSVPPTLPTSGPALTPVATSRDLCCGDQDPGFFTSVSSLGASNVVIWAVTRPYGANPNPATATDPGGYPMTLWAFSESLTDGKLTRLAQVVGGEWGPDSLGGNANTVPVVANGQVYVASYKQLRVFGLK